MVESSSVNWYWKSGWDHNWSAAYSCCNIYSSLNIVPGAGMIKEGYGLVVNISSIAGKAAISGRTAYCPAKFAVFGLMDSVRYEVCLTSWEGIGTSDYRGLHCPLANKTISMLTKICGPKCFIFYQVAILRKLCICISQPTTNLQNLAGLSG